MKRTLFLIALTVCMSPAFVSAQSAMNSAEPFKLGTFEIHGEGDKTIGIVLRDQIIVELNAANMAVEQGPDYPAIPMPENMRELIGRYEYGLRYRLYEIVNYVVSNNRLSGRTRADFVHDVEILLGMLEAFNMFLIHYERMYAIGEFVSRHCFEKSFPRICGLI